MIKEKIHMNVRRKERYKRYNEYYKWYHKDKRCYYCGDIATTKDHVPSLYYLDGVGLENLTAKPVLVSCCSECNTMLGKDSSTLELNVKFLYKKIQKKYKKILESSVWEEDELEEIDEGYLKDYIITHSNVAHYINSKLEYMEDLHYDWV